MLNPWLHEENQLVVPVGTLIRVMVLKDILKSYLTPKNQAAAERRKIIRENCRARRILLIRFTSFIPEINYHV